LRGQGLDHPEDKAFLSRSGGIHHLALRVREPETSVAFYAGILGLEVLRRDPGQGPLRAAWLKIGDSVLMLERELRGRGPGAGSGHLLSFAVDDLERTIQRLATAGVAVEDRTAHTLYVRDPDGHRVGLSALRLER